MGDSGVKGCDMVRNDVKCPYCGHSETYMLSDYGEHLCFKCGGFFELVPDSIACPYCNENRMDMLVWDEFELLNCETCGTVYDPEDILEAI